MANSKKTQNLFTMTSVVCGAAEAEGEGGGLCFYETKGRQATIKAEEAGRSARVIVGK
jgi:hypothetical protein